LLRLYDDNLFFQFSNPVPDDEELAVKQEFIDLNAGVITINEVREKRGLSPVKWGDEPYVKVPDQGQLDNNDKPKGGDKDEKNRDNGTTPKPEKGNLKLAGTGTDIIDSMGTLPR
jgi:hypothetical protein